MWCHNENFVLQYLMMMIVKLSVVCVCVCATERFEPSIVQVQDFFKDVNAQCNVLSVGQPSDNHFESRVVKNDIKVLKIVAQ